MRVCQRCLMDTSDQDITFNSNGFCNYCCQYFENLNRMTGGRILKDIVNEIKRNSHSKHGCVLGISGGVDSSYAALLAFKSGLKVLLTHFDNGYDDPIAARNVQRIVKETGFDMVEYTMDLDEFHDLQIAYLKSGVIDIEAITDHAIIATNYNLADRYGIKYLLTGSNYVTEAIMPSSWSYRKTDLTNIKNIHKRFGRKKLRTFPHMGSLKLAWYKAVKGIQLIRFLDYTQYNRQEAIKTLEKEFGYEDYGPKHYESIFTRFYQAYILPTKFGVDKRKAHLSTLICSGQITREQAIEELNKPLYTPENLERDRNFILNKLGITIEEFDEIIKSPPCPNKIYGTDEWLYNLLKHVKKVLT